MEASATLDAIEDDASTLEPAVGGVPRIFQIWWEAYALWFTVHVVAHDPEASTHTIRYEIDGELETIDLRSERWVRILVPSEYDAIATRVDRALDAAAQLGPRPARCLACVQREYDKAVRAREAARAIVEADEIERWENERAAREAYVRGDVRALETRRETSVSPSTHAVTPSSVGFVPGARVLVRFDDGADYAGTVFGVHGAEPAARLYTVHFDDGDKLDDVAAHEMRLGDGGAAAAAGGPLSSDADDRLAVEVLDANEAYTRFLIKWAGRARPTWESSRRVPPCLIEQFIGWRQAEFNRTLEPTLGAAHSGVVAVHVPEEAAAACAGHLQAHWADGRLQLGAGKVCTGYASYTKVLSAHDAGLQRQHTLLLTNALLPHVRTALPGFAAIEAYLVEWLEEQYGTVVELFYAHGLRQGPETLMSTGFAVHQDTEDYDFIEFTVVVKLTPDGAGEPPSAMRVVGAARPFEYGAAAGSSGCFRARLYHASVAPTSPEEHLKIAYFFRKSTMGEQRAKRARDSADGHELAQRRKAVATQLGQTVLGAGPSLQA